jgi:hypothetical protein
MIIEFQGAHVHEQTVNFAIVVVANSVIDSQSQSVDIRVGYERLFGGDPVVLAAQDIRGNFRYRGRHDLVKFLVALEDPLSQIPWKKYTYSL